MWPLKSDDRANGLEMIPTPESASWEGAIRRVMAVARSILNLLLFTTAFFLAYLYGMSFHHVSSAPFWPPDAVLLCALLLTPWQRWWLYWASRRFPHSQGRRHACPSEIVSGPPGRSGWRKLP